MNKKFHILLSVLLLVVMTLSACAPAATPAPAEEAAAPAEEAALQQKQPLPRQQK